MSINTISPAPTLEHYFSAFRKNIIGQGQIIETPYGFKRMIYADWTASGRLYKTIEDNIRHSIAPFVANTHTETNITGTSMTLGYHYAQKIIKKHVNASENDVLIMTGSGMTGAVNKFQRILGFKSGIRIENEIDRPVVFVSSLEHHSNDVSWRETNADVVLVNLCPNGNIDLKHLKVLLEKYKDRKLKIAAVTGCSNVTGIQTPYYKVAKIMHKNGGKCFVDFACSAPYVKVNMHPKEKLEQLDAIYFSMHKFLGGPSAPGVLLFNKELYKNAVPDHPGGGTVQWVNSWGEQAYHSNEEVAGIEAREDGGTPPFLQTMRAALAVKLKEEMGMKNIMKREEELLEIIFDGFEKIPNLTILAGNQKERMGVVSFMVKDLHYNLGVKLLNDHFGIQVRGGCACAGPYGHCLLNISQDISKSISNKVTSGDLTAKPGWIRMSIHPTMTNEEVKYIVSSISEVCENFEAWAKDYHYNPNTNEFENQLRDDRVIQMAKVAEWFDVKMS